MKFISNSAEETMRLAAGVARHIGPGSVLCLQGELGCGKTTFVKGFAEGISADRNDVQSPTFVLMRMYEGRLPVYHFDLYRLEEGADAALAGYEEFIEGEGVALIEWPERLRQLLPEERLTIRFRHLGGDGREIYLSADGCFYGRIMEEVRRELSLGMNRDD